MRGIFILTYHDLLMDNTPFHVAAQLHDRLLIELEHQFAAVHPLAVHVGGVFELDQEAKSPH